MTIVHQPELRVRRGKQVSEHNATLSPVREDAYVAVAADLGIDANGYWPVRLTTDLGNGQDFVFVAILPGKVRRYEQSGSNQLLFVG